MGTDDDNRDKPGKPAPEKGDGKAPPEKRRSSFFQYLIAVLIGLLLLGVGVISTLIYMEYGGKDGGRPAPVISDEERLARQEKLATEAEARATWETYHCLMLHRYYVGPEVPAPVAELIGLDAGADQGAIDRRCRDILPVVRMMGGFPSSKSPKDNFVVCSGFRFHLKGDYTLTLIPTREDLAASQVAYTLGDGVRRTENITRTGISTISGHGTPGIVQVDDNCIVASTPRFGRRRDIAGSIERVPQP